MFFIVTEALITFFPRMSFPALAQLFFFSPQRSFFPNSDNAILRSLSSSSWLKTTCWKRARHSRQVNPSRSETTRRGTPDCRYEARETESRVGPCETYGSHLKASQRETFIKSSNGVMDYNANTRVMYFYSPGQATDRKWNFQVSHKVFFAAALSRRVVSLAFQINFLWVYPRNRRRIT